MYCAIALGSNLGDSLNYLNSSLQELERDSEIELVLCSRWYKTTAVGPPQPDYLNGCAILRVHLSPNELLRRLLEIERQFGRVRNIYWGPRTLDLDLLLYEDIILDSPDLQIPHPRMKERAFVLVPLSEIVPNWIEPITGQTIKELLQCLYLNNS